MTLDFTDSASLVKAYKSFCENTDHVNLIIKSANKFTEACKAFNSIFTHIKAAGGIVRNQDDEYLFIKRFGIWDLPKGKLHKNESTQGGALREVTEETGLTNLKIIKQLQSTYHIYTNRKGREVLKETFWFEMMSDSDQKLIPQLEEDITEVKWFSASELNIPLQSTYASLRLLLESYLQI